MTALSPEATTSTCYVQLLCSDQVAIQKQIKRQACWRLFLEPSCRILLYFVDFKRQQDFPVDFPANISLDCLDPKLLLQSHGSFPCIARVEFQARHLGPGLSTS